MVQKLSIRSSFNFTYDLLSNKLSFSNEKHILKLQNFALSQYRVLYLKEINIVYDHKRPIQSSLLNMQVAIHINFQSTNTMNTCGCFFHIKYEKTMQNTHKHIMQLHKSHAAAYKIDHSITCSMIGLS